MKRKFAFITIFILVLLSLEYFDVLHVDIDTIKQGLVLSASLIYFMSRSIVGKEVNTCIEISKNKMHFKCECILFLC